MGICCFVAEGDRARAVPVETGAERDLLLEITSGLKAGDTLICDGLRPELLTLIFLGQFG
jgi:multidrug efflux pump subunit AcrA (membrane-fusion protein)